MNIYDNEIFKEPYQIKEDSGLKIKDRIKENLENLETINKSKTEKRPISRRVYPRTTTLQAMLSSRQTERKEIHTDGLA